MQKIIALLDQLNIEYDLHEHRAVHTMDDLEDIWSKLDGCPCKNLFVRNQKGNKHYLVVVHKDDKVDMKQLAVILDSGKLSFCSPNRIEKYLKSVPGAVSPLCLVHDTENAVQLWLSESIMKYDKLLFHPNDNTKTVVIGKDDFERFLQEIKVEARPFSF